MKKSALSHFILFGVITLLLFSCSRKKDKFINRSWHAMTTRNNTLYNGEVSFLEGKQSLVENYEDNYWKQLPIERLEIRDEVLLESESSNPQFSYAEDKAAKAIQKHSMVIGGREKNPKTDDAFLLLGKARYFDQRFIPALEAFNYILYKYPTSNSINHARVWKAKVNIRLDNNEGAVKSLKRLFKSGARIEDQDLADASAMLAQAYVNLKHKDSAIAPMKIACEKTKSNEERGRYYYILGQLYNRVRERDSANMVFDKLIKLNRRTPREYLINAYLAKARNLEIESDDQLAFLDILNKLEKNWENRPFLDKIYYEKAIYFFGADSLKLASEYYEKSLRTNTEDNYLRSLSYETLGRIVFNKGEYQKAGAYMDSTLQLIDDNSKRYRVIKKKRDNLDDVILYEGIAKNNDSILKIASLSPTDQLAYYQKYTDSIKAIKASKIKKQKAAKAKSLLGTNPTLADRSFAKKDSDEQEFYFYNPVILANGKLQFERLFGKRKLIDFWKIASLNEFNDVAEAIEEIDEEYDINTDPLFDPKLYVAKIPTEVKVIDSLKGDRNEAYFQLGTLYKEQLTEYSKATEKFEALLLNNPDERYIVPTKYNLYKIYQSVGNTIREELYRQDIMKNHPETRYAAIVKDPFNAVTPEGEGTPGQEYTKLYRIYDKQQYHKLLPELDRRIKDYSGDPIVPKFELLKAYTLGKSYGVGKMKEALNFIALTYPQSDEGKKAQELYDSTVPYLESLTFEADTSGTRKYNLLYDFRTSEVENAEKLRTELDTLIKKRNFNYLKTSVDFYSKDTLLVVIHGLKGKKQAFAMNSILTDSLLQKVNKEFYLSRNGLSVSSENYRVIQSHKKYETYIALKDSVY